MDENQLFNSVNDIIQSDIKQFIEADGGKITLKKVENGIVWVQLSGACAGCSGAVMTLKGGVEKILKSKLPEVKSVKLAY